MSVKGNQNAKKLKTKATKDKVYKSYCAWIATGKSKGSWRYSNRTGLRLTSRSMETYIKNTEDFPPEHKRQAEAASLEIWEKYGLDMMLGKIEKCQPALFQMFMRNKFGWDKKELNDKDTANLIVKAYHYAIEKDNDRKKKVKTIEVKPINSQSV